jgi:hypothetical protein
MTQLLTKSVVQGEVNKKLYFLVTKRDKTGKMQPFDLTGFTLQIVIYDLLIQTIIVDHETVTQDILTANNACFYNNSTASSLTDGDYLARLVISVGSQIIKTKEFNWHVEKSK